MQGSQLTFMPKHTPRAAMAARSFDKGLASAEGQKLEYFK
jgi:hypothetical protein